MLLFQKLWLFDGIIKTFMVTFYYTLLYLPNFPIPTIFLGSEWTVFISIWVRPGGGGGGGVLWVCAAGTLKPLAYARPRSNAFCNPIID